MVGWGAPPYVWGLPPQEKILVCLDSSTSIHQRLLAGKNLLYAIILYCNWEIFGGEAWVFGGEASPPPPPPVDWTLTIHTFSKCAWCSIQRSASVEPWICLGKASEYGIHSVLCIVILLPTPHALAISLVHPWVFISPFESHSQFTLKPPQLAWITALVLFVPFSWTHSNYWWRQLEVAKTSREISFIVG